MAQQTAMQKLLTNLESIGITIPLGVQMVYLKIEKEQIITAASIGILWGEDVEQLQLSVKFGEEYYDRTFTSTPPSENPSATRTEQF